MLSASMIQSVIGCAFACDQPSHCQTFGYNSSASSTSVVKFVEIAPGLCAATHDQACAACEQIRYEVGSVIHPSHPANIQMGMKLSGCVRASQWLVDAMEVQAQIRQYWRLTRTIEQAEQWQRSATGQHSCILTTEHRSCI